MRAEKQLLLDEIQEKIEGFGSFIITRYEGLNAGIDSQFRGLVAKSGGDYEVVRKRIFLKALSAKGVNLDPKTLQGHIGVVFTGEDAIETTQVVFKFGKDNPGVFSVVGGQIDGTLYDADQVERLSQLPGKDEMRAQFLGLLEAPMSQTLAVMEALLTSLPHLLENKVQKEQGNE
ncbi:MAG: large subunit ribosomal protein L10 [Chlamydiales bacterium]|jgi:large subunit ribosomal protein L10